jgi:hypothetical protein
MRVTEANVPPVDDRTRRAIVSKLYFALSNLGAADELLAIVGSWGDTMDDARTLDHLTAAREGHTDANMAQVAFREAARAAGILAD